MARLRRHPLARARQRIERLPVALDRRVDRWDLLLLSQKLRQDRLDLLPRQHDWRLADDLALCVVGGRLDAEANRRAVRLAALAQILGDARRLAHADWQDAGCQRV